MPKEACRRTASFLVAADARLAAGLLTPGYAAVRLPVRIQVDSGIVNNSTGYSGGTVLDLHQLPFSPPADLNADSGHRMRAWF